MDYMSLFIRKYTQNQQLLSSFSDILKDRNSLLAEVLSEEQFAEQEENLNL